MDIYLIKYFLYAYGSFIAYVTDVLSWVLSICCMPIETLRLQELYSIGYRCTFMGIKYMLYADRDFTATGAL